MTEQLYLDDTLTDLKNKICACLTRSLDLKITAGPYLLAVQRRIEQGELGPDMTFAAWHAQHIVTLDIPDQKQRNICTSLTYARECMQLANAADAEALAQEIRDRKNSVDSAARQKRAAERQAEKARKAAKRQTEKDRKAAEAKAETARKAAERAQAKAGKVSAKSLREEAKARTAFSPQPNKAIEASADSAEKPTTPAEPASPSSTEKPTTPVEQASPSPAAPSPAEPAAPSPYDCPLLDASNAACEADRKTLAAVIAFEYCPQCKWRREQNKRQMDVDAAGDRHRQKPSAKKTRGNYSRNQWTGAQCICNRSDTANRPAATGLDRRGGRSACRTNRAANENPRPDNRAVSALGQRRRVSNGAVQLR